MEIKNAYMVIDIGTGNVRVAITANNGDILSVERTDVIYTKDDLYEDALSFDPNYLWDEIITLAKTALTKAGGIHLLAITASSQREGIVLIDSEGNSLLGLPNHDHRGRGFEAIVKDPSRVYELTGRYPSSLFSAMKLVGVRAKKPEIYNQCKHILSISDWAQFKLTGIMGYEHAQASETLLYDVAKKEWSASLCEMFEIEGHMLPPLHQSGSVMGNILPAIADLLKLPMAVKVIVGGADTQLAIKSTMPAIGDVIIVSGTTTPVTVVVDAYFTDPNQKTWTGRHLNDNEFVLEANAGVTGLNIQRLKEIFYPNEGYEVMEKELFSLHSDDCVASLGSSLADETGVLNKGGFIFSIPVTQQLHRADFIKAAIWDMTCAIKANFDTLCRVKPYTKEDVWACGGGFQSTYFAQCLANLLHKNVRIRNGYRQASVAGATIICNETLGMESFNAAEFITIKPNTDLNLAKAYRQWLTTREKLKQVFTA